MEHDKTYYVITLRGACQQKIYLRLGQYLFLFSSFDVVNIYFCSHLLMYEMRFSLIESLGVFCVKKSKFSSLQETIHISCLPVNSQSYLPHLGKTTTLWCPFLTEWHMPLMWMLCELLWLWLMEKQIGIVRAD